MKINVTCRLGINYDTIAYGTTAEKERLKEMLSSCCCYVCHNHDCSSAVNKKIECNEECKLFTASPYCQRKKLWVARNFNGSLKLFHSRPVRCETIMESFWRNESNDGYSLTGDDIDDTRFDELRWKDDPVETF